MKNLLKVAIGFSLALIAIGYSSESKAMGAKARAEYVFNLDGPYGKTRDYSDRLDDKILPVSQASLVSLFIIGLQLDANAAAESEVRDRCLTYRLTRGGLAKDINVVLLRGVRGFNYITNTEILESISDSRTTCAAF